MRKKARELASRPDAEIDYSDIAPLTPGFFKNAVRNPLYRPIKQQLTVRLDADVVAWLRKKGKGYQTRINLVLRNAMTQEVLKDRPRSK
ncbi:MAG TPA: BrnA antitoxin family protein [Steroidobacteraceae bacterium]